MNTAEMNMTKSQEKEVEFAILRTLRFAEMGSSYEWVLTSLEITETEHGSIEVCSRVQSASTGTWYTYQAFISRRGGLSSYDHKKGKMVHGYKARYTINMCY